MAAAKPKPIDLDQEPLTEAECATLADAEAVRAAVDAADGYPRQGQRLDGKPLPPGEGMVLHHYEIEAVDVDDDGMPTRWATHVPEHAEIPAAVRARVTARKPSEIRAAKAARDEKMAEIERRRPNKLAIV